MSEKITTADELDALPVGSVVLEGGDGRPQDAGPFGIPVMPGVFHRFPDGWYVVAGHGAREPEFDLGPLTVLHRPDRDLLAEAEARGAREALTSAASALDAMPSRWPGHVLRARAEQAGGDRG